jgi:molybdopterin converting factor small subunit
MGITIDLPAVLWTHARGSTVRLPSAGCGTVAEAIALLAALHPGVVDRMMDERGELRPHVNLFVDGTNIRFASGLQTALGAESVIDVVPAVSGG